MRTRSLGSMSLCASVLVLCACSRTPLLVASYRIDAGAAKDSRAGSGGGAGTGTPANPTLWPDSGASASAGTGATAAGAFDAGSFAFVDAGVDAGASMAEADAGTPPDGGYPARGPMTITYTTLDRHGIYSPHNIGAVWIENTRGVYVKTLEKWGFIRSSYLVAWLTASGGNTVDAVTSATLSTLVTHQATWNMNDLNQQYVPDGDYNLKIEFTDQSSAGPVATFLVHKGPGAVDNIPPDQGYIANVLISYH